MRLAFTHISASTVVSRATVLLAIAPLYAGVLPSGKAQAQEQISPETILARLRAFDDLYTSGLTVNGSEKEDTADIGVLLRNYSTLSAKRVTESAVRFTVAGGKLAVEEDGEATYLNCVPPRNNERKRSVLVVEGGFFVTNRQFFEPEAQSAWITEKTSREIGNLGLYERHILWAIGRDFSRYLHEISSVSMTGTQLSVEATGTFDSTGESGTWTLLIDPSRSYLVTQASYKPAEGSVSLLSIDMKAFDPVTNGDCVYPTRSTIDFAGGAKTVEYEFTEATLEFDDQFYQYALAEVNKQAPDGSAVEDYLNGGKVVTTIVGSKPPPKPAALVPPTRKAKRIHLWLIGGNIVLLAGLVTWIMIRKSRSV